MTLRKETYYSNYYTDSNFYEKIYSDTGKILLEKINNSTKEYSYDTFGKLTKVLETIGWRDRKYEHNYEHDGEDYRIITVLKEEGTDHTLTYDFERKVLVGPDPESNDMYIINEITEIKEFKFKNGKPKSERISDLKSNNSINKVYTYEGNDLIKEIIEENGKSEIYKYKYENNKLIEKQHLEGENIVSKIIYIYDQDLIIAEETVRFYQNSTEYISYIKKYYYNSKKKLTKTECCGRYDSKLELYDVQEIIEEESVIIQKGGQVQDYYLGFYNLEELNDFYRKEFEKDKNLRDLDLTSDIPGTFNYVRSEFNPYVSRDSENEDFSQNYNHHYERVYDTNNKIIKETSYNPLNMEEVFDRLFFHYEYNELKLLEYEACFKIQDDFNIIHIYTKKYYYK